MLTASDIKNIAFSKSVNGYKRDEVDVFLDSVESDYVQFQHIIKDYQSKIEELQSQIEGFKSSQNSIQNVLLNAQKLADQIVTEAKEKSEEIIRNAEANINVITAQEKELAAAFENKANERKGALQKELDSMIEKANLKAKSVTDAAADAVRRQQVLFDKLKIEIAAFKTAITAKYKDHLSILQDIPDTVDMSPEKLAEVISAKIDVLPEIESFIPTEKKVEVAEDPVIEEVPTANGFKVEAPDSLSSEE